MVVVPFNRKFRLHPGGFLLGATLEFISLPNDIAGFILSRSGYGRTGLLIAAATYVHPGWKGCLTLELENLGGGADCTSARFVCRPTCFDES